MTHHCHAKGCTIDVPPKMLMCRKHWFTVPADLQREVWAHYVPGQENRKDPTPAYLDVMQRAINAVAEIETRKLRALKALTVMQPWAFLLMSTDERRKDIENRNWAPPFGVIGQRIAIHAGKAEDSRAMARHIGAFFGEERLSWRGLLGTVELVGYARADGTEIVSRNQKDQALVGAALKSEWRHEDAAVLWVTRDPRPLAEPIPCKGAQGLWEVPADIATRVRALEAA